MKQVLKNHVAIVIDKSTSMSRLMNQVVEIFNNKIDYLRDSSIRHDQETRVSVYTFSDEVENLIFDVDVTRPMTLKNIKANGMTALMDGVALAIRDMEEISQKYGDHSFIVYLLTDGMENRSNISKSQFKKLLEATNDNLIVAAFAPGIDSIRELEFLGLEKGNIEKWDVNNKGLEEVGNKFERSMDSYFESRSKGIKISNSLFSDLNKATVKDVKKVAKEVKKYDIVVNGDVKAVQIRDLVEDKLNITYKKGSAFYELVKNEHVQESKEIAVQDKKSGKVYKGYEARKILGLPNSGKVKVDVKDFDNKKWIIYIQSGSVNRNVIPKQRVLVV